jgi:hypothetical protein
MVSCRIRIPVRVINYYQLAVCTSDLLVGSVAVNTQYLVIVFH